MTAEPIGDAALAEVVRLAEGARRQGPWHECSAEEDEWGHRFQKVTEKATGFVVAHVYGDHAAYIAAANPATVLAMGSRITAAEAERDRLRAALQTGINAMDIYCRDLLAAGESKLAREWRVRLLAAHAALAGADR